MNLRAKILFNTMEHYNRQVHYMTSRFGESNVDFGDAPKPWPVGLSCMFFLLWCCHPKYSIKFLAVLVIATRMAVALSITIIILFVVTSLSPSSA